MTPLPLHPAALAELEEAVRWIDDQRPGYGALFYEEIQRRTTQAARFPTSGAPIVGFAKRHDVRAFTTKVFEYRVVTALIRNERLVLAIAHDSRDPRYWRDRLGG